MALRIVIDARRIRDFGIGTYIRNLVHALAAIDTANQYMLVSGPGDVRTLAGLPVNFELPSTRATTIRTSITSRFRFCTASPPTWFTFR